MKHNIRSITAENYRLYKSNPDGFRLKWDSIKDCLDWTVSFYGDDRALTAEANQERGRGNRWKRRAGWKLTSIYSLPPCHCGASPCAHYGWMESGDYPVHWYVSPETELPY